MDDGNNNNKNPKRHRDADHVGNHFERRVRALHDLQRHLPEIATNIETVQAELADADDGPPITLRHGHQ